MPTPSALVARSVHDSPQAYSDGLVDEVELFAVARDAVEAFRGGGDDDDDDGQEVRESCCYWAAAVAAVACQVIPFFEGPSIRRRIASAERLRSNNETRDS